MEFVDRPIVDFYRHSLSAAYKRGFLWVVTLLAREADVEGLYSNLRKSWTSLDSITGKYFLFIFAGKENITHNDRWASRVVDSEVQYFSEYNDYVKFINPNIELEHSCIHDSYHKNTSGNIDRLEENQTAAVNALRDYFSISESKIPCLVFTRLNPFGYVNDIIQVVSISGNSIYGYFKCLFNTIDPLLKKHMDFAFRLKELAEYKQELKKRTSQTQTPLKFEGKILALQRELLSYADKNIVDGRGRTLLDCINDLSYGTFDMPLRGMLSRYVDWVKNYEKRTGQRFDSELVDQKIYQNSSEIAKAKVELSIVENQQNELGEKCAEIISEIERIIGDSKMDENTCIDNRLSISVMGGTAQINAAFDNAKVEATQHVGYDENKLAELVGNIRDTLSTGISADDIEIAASNLYVIEDELNGGKPRKSFLKVALKSLEAIKGTVEFGAAVAALVQFIQPML